jgi:hypothetical protein
MQSSDNIGLKMRYYFRASCSDLAEHSRMKKSSLLAGLIIAGALALSAVRPAFATELCAVVDKTCKAGDPSFVASSESVNYKLTPSRLTGSFTCSGHTTDVPKKEVTCNGEKLGGSEGNPAVPCGTSLDGITATTDDWKETIFPSGKVSVKCTFGGSDTQ